VSRLSESAPLPGFHHAAVFYRGLDDLVARVVPFVAEGLAKDQPVLVVEAPDRAQALSAALGEDAGRVEFLDMAEVGGNPARIIPAWLEFVAAHPGEDVRGVGEPVWPGRTAAELDECQLHEALLNVAFDDIVGTGFRLLCPYDADALPEDVIDGALRTHPYVDPATRAVGYGGHRHAEAHFGSPLSAVPTDAVEIPFCEEDLPGLRTVVRRLGEGARLGHDVIDDLVLAVHELATNSVRHGGGAGVLHGWQDTSAVVLEVSDPGVIEDLLVGREPADAWAESGRGLWMANRLCDLVQLRSSPQGTRVRLYSWL
jgi:anti-sigma regulatory factor (Ser/Thr protein kinase)